MKQVNLGVQGLKVPAIGLGCMGMSEFYGAFSESENLRVLDRAVSLGCTFWDTSDIYGPFTNEILLSKALVGRRDKITLATKFGISRGEDGSFQGLKGGFLGVKLLNRIQVLHGLRDVASNLLRDLRAHVGITK